MQELRGKMHREHPKSLPPSKMELFELVRTKVGAEVRRDMLPKVQAQFPLHVKGELFQEFRREVLGDVQGAGDTLHVTLRDEFDEILAARVMPQSDGATTESTSPDLKRQLEEMDAVMGDLRGYIYSRLERLKKDIKSWADWYEDDVGYDALSTTELMTITSPI